MDRGILTNGDIKDAEGHIFTIEYIKNDLQLNCDFLMYNRLKKEYSLSWAVIRFHKMIILDQDFRLYYILLRLVVRVTKILILTHKIQV